MKKITIGIVVLLALFILFLSIGINSEEKDFVSKYEMIDGKKVKELVKSKPNYYVIFISSMCPGSDDFMPKLVKNIETLKKLNIPFIVVSDELYNKELDDNLNNYIASYKFNNKVYIMDKDLYQDNGGLFNNKRRYNDFLLDLLDNNHNVLNAYGIYLHFENGKYVDFDNTIKFNLD